MDKAEKQGQGGKGHTAHGDKHADDFIDDHDPWVPVIENLFSFSRCQCPRDKENKDNGKIGQQVERLEQEKKQQAHKGAPGAGGFREVAGVTAGRYQHNQGVHFSSPPAPTLFSP